MHTHDLTGMRCPLPIVELNRIVKGLADGDEFEVRVDDPAFTPDVAAWCRLTGHELVVSERTEAGVCRAVIRVHSTQSVS